MNSYFEIFFVAAIAGAILGALQSLAVRPRLGTRWIVGSSLGLAVGMTLAIYNAGPSNFPADIKVFALITAIGFGIGQASSVRWNLKASALWVSSTVGIWVSAWLISAGKIFDIAGNYLVVSVLSVAAAMVLSGFVLAQIVSRHSDDSHLSRDHGDAGSDSLQLRFS